MKCWLENMGQVSIALNGRTYRLACADGEEARLGELAALLKSKVDDIGREFGSIGIERILLMAALLIGDELLDARAGLEDATASGRASLKAVADAEKPPGKGGKSSAADRDQRKSGSS